MTNKTKQKAQIIIYYDATYPDAFIWCYANDMITCVYIDSVYLVLLKAKRRIAGYYYFRGNTEQLNGAICIEYKTLRHVVPSAAEAKTGSVFHNTQKARPLRLILIVMNIFQSLVPLETDNTTAVGFVRNNI